MNQPTLFGRVQSDDFGDRFKNPKNHPLPGMLDCAIPLWILQYEDEYAITGEFPQPPADAGQLIAERGDVLQFGSKKKGEAAELFNTLAKSIACMAFVPGGVKCFGRHWKAGPENKGNT